MIRTLIFDLGKVIVPFDFNRAYAKMAEHSGMPVADIPGKLAETGLYRRFESGLIEPRAFVDEITGHLGIRMEYSDFCDVWTSIFFPETLLSDEFVGELARRFRLILLSNTNFIHFEMVRASYPVLRHFHSFVLSYEVGEMKPSPGIYRKAIEVAGCRPEECVFVDDILENAEAARAAGIDGIHFESAAQLEEEFRRRGLI